MRRRLASSRAVALVLSAASAAAMLYVGLFQVRAVEHLICPLFGGCEAVADAPFARPFGVPDGFLALGLYVVIFLGLLAPPRRRGWTANPLVGLAALAGLFNVLGVGDMARLGAYCFYCLFTTALAPLLLWATWQATRPRG